MRILWLKTELLHPVDKGGKIRTYNMLKELKREHHITYLTLDDGNAAPDALELANEYCHEVITIAFDPAPKNTFRFYREVALNLVSPLPYFMQKYRSPAMLEMVEKLAAEREFDILICDFLVTALNVPGNLPIPSVLFQHNVEAMIWKRHYENSAGPIRKALMKGQWKKTERYEKQACRQFDAVVTVSKDDSEVIRRSYGVSRVYDVPTGVDTEYFSCAAENERNGNEIVFTGSMDWLPNDDAIRWFVSDIFPQIRSEISDVRFTIVGRDPSPSLMELARRDPSLEVTGRVDDVRPYMERASVFVVPIRIGGGTRLKIFEAMAMKLPVVSTTIGAEGLPVTDGKDLLICDDAIDLSQAVITLIRDKVRADSIAQNAMKRMREEFSWRSVANRFADLCATTIRDHGNS